MRQQVLRGWNGTIVLNDAGVEIKRGLRDVLVRKRRDPGRRISFHEIGGVRYMPARGLVGYLQVVDHASGQFARGYVATVRDPRTVTFSRRSAWWRALARTIAERAGVELKELPPAPYWSAVFGSRGGPRRRQR